MPLEKDLILNLKKIKINRLQDSASKLLFSYCEGANAFHYRLDGHGFDKLIFQIGKEGKLIIQHDTNMLEYLTQSFFKDDPLNNDLLFPKSEKFYQLDVKNYINFLKKDFKPKEFDINCNYLEDEIYHFSVSDENIKNHITKDISIKFYLISVSIVYNNPNVTMLVQEGADLKIFYTKILKEKPDRNELINALCSKELEKFISNSKNKLNKQEKINNNYAKIITLVRFDWKKISNIDPNYNQKEYEKCFDWYESRLSCMNNTIIQKYPPNNHLKRWVWLPSYFNST